MAVRHDVFLAVGPSRALPSPEDVGVDSATAKGYRLAYVPQIGIHTPARETFADLGRKWDRHIAHDYAVIPAGPVGWSKWVLRAAAMAVSPLAEIPRVAFSDMLSGPGSRLKAFAGLVRLRFYRAGRMLFLAFGGDPTRLSGAWNRN